MTNRLYLLLDIRGRRPAGDKLQLFKEIWSQIEQLECSTIRQLISEPRLMLFDALKSDNVNVVLWLLEMSPELLAQKDSNGRNLFHVAALYRRKRIFKFLTTMGATNLIIQEVDNNNNNVLHLAAHILMEESSNLKPDIRLSRGHKWFKVNQIVVLV